MIELKFTGTALQVLEEMKTLLGDVQSVQSYAASDPAPLAAVHDEKSAIDAKSASPLENQIEAEDKPRGRGRPKKEIAVVPVETSETVDSAEVDPADVVTAEDVLKSEPRGQAEAEIIEPEEVDEPAMTAEELRRYTIDKYLNAKVHGGQEQASAAYRALLAELDVKAFGDITQDRVPAVKARVDELAAAKGVA